MANTKSASTMEVEKRRMKTDDRLQSSFLNKFEP